MNIYDGEQRHYTWVVNINYSVEPTPTETQREQIEPGTVIVGTRWAARSVREEMDEHLGGG